MPSASVATATCMCSFGSAPCPLVATPNRVFVGGPLSANILDYKIINIPTFTTCSSPTSSFVIANKGNPVPCVPAIATPWVKGPPTVLVNGIPILTNTSTNVCTLGGAITISTPGQIPVLTTM